MPGRYPMKTNDRNIKGRLEIVTKIKVNVGNCYKEINKIDIKCLG